LPIRDIAENLTANALAARLAAGHDTLRGGHDGDAESALDATDLIAANVHAAAGTRDALQVADRRLVVGAVLQVHAENPLTVLLGRLVVGDIALVLEDAGDLRLELRSRNIKLLVTGPDGVADTGQKVCYWIGEVHSFSFISRSLADVARREPAKMSCCLMVTFQTSAL